MVVKKQIAFANEHLGSMLGYPVDQLVGKNEGELFSSDGEYNRWLRVASDQISKVGTASVETRFKCMDGSIIDIWLGAAPVDAADAAAGITCTALDITARKRAEEDMRFLASHDSLTRLPNRNLFMDRLASALAIARRNKIGVAVMFIDLDDFKQVNDEMGHEVGDEVLKQTAARIMACLRESDTIARFGGDEFLVLLPMTTSREAVAGVGDKIVAALRQGFKVNGTETRLSCSVGIAMFPEHGSQFEALINEADAAMYAAKKAGKNGYHFVS
jgi:diguanylate cyclase (GGDEF)-like protein/PAS domain S-box-containing protein